MSDPKISECFSQTIISLKEAKMKVTKILIPFLFVVSVFAQSEKAPIQEREVKYRDWTYKSVENGREIRLSDFLKGKKLVLVVYFSPWCPNWKNQAPLTQKLYETYKSNGFDVIGVGEYDSVEAIRRNIADLKITFPVVYESESREAKQKTLHYEYRKRAGDTRNWGSPWNIFIEPAKINSDSEILVEKAYVVNGELIGEEAESFIKQKLGLDKQGKTTFQQKREEKKIEACDPSKMPELKKP